MAFSEPPPPLPPRPLSPIYSPPASPFPAKDDTVTGTSPLSQIKALLRQLLRITVNDGRIFIGTFAGTDKPLNLILVNAEEFRLVPGRTSEGRYVGQIMLPWKIIVKVEADMEKPQSGGAMYM